MSSELTRLRREVFGPSPEAARELAELWRQVFGQPPPVTGTAALLSEILVGNLPQAPPYQPVAQAPARVAGEVRAFPGAAAREPVRQPSLTSSSEVLQAVHTA